MSFYDLNCPVIWPISFLVKGYVQRVKHQSGPYSHRPYMRMQEVRI